MSNNEIFVKTPLGEIRVFDKNDPEYPGVWLQFIPEGKDSSVDPFGMVEYDATHHAPVVRIWSKVDPDGDPKGVMCLSDSPQTVCDLKSLYGRNYID